MNKIFYSVRILTVLILSISIIGCGGDDEEEDKKIDSPVTSTETITIVSNEIRGDYLLENRWNTLRQSWGENGYQFKLFLVQGTGISYVGKANTNETSLEDEHSDVTVNVPITSMINTDYDYRIIAVDHGCETTMNNGAIVCDGNLSRSPQLRVYGFYVSDVGKGFVSSAETQFITASECLWIKNYSEKPIKVRHKGYEASEKWYYTSAKVRIVNNGSIMAIPEGGAVGQDVSSEEVDIAAGETGLILSRFVPNGNKMKDAILILDIDGKEIKTPPASSNKAIENGKPYFLRVSWDGSSLEWITQ